MDAYFGGTDYSNYAGLNHLSNQGYYGITYSTACDVAAFDRAADTSVIHASVMEAFTDLYPDKGSVAFVGNTRLGYQGITDNSQYWWTKCIFKNSPTLYNRLGGAEAFSKLSFANGLSSLSNWAGWYGAYSDNLFGSPEMDPWTNTPRPMVVYHPTSTPSGQRVNFTVTVRDESTSAPISYATTCLYKFNDIYRIGQTNMLGQVTFNICPQSTGQMQVTCSRPHWKDGILNWQWLPHRSFCQVVYPMPSPVADKHEISNGAIGPTELSLRIASNPSVNSANIVYGIPKETMVRLSIYNPLGGRIAILTDRILPRGYYRVTFDLRKEELAGGIYWLVLEQENKRITKKLTLLR